MKFLNCSANIFFHKIKERRVVCFGTSKYVATFSQKTGNLQWMEHIDCFVDNNTDLHGKDVSYGEKKWKVYSPDYLRKAEDTILLITPGINRNILEIAKQLQAMNLPEEMECYSLCMVERYAEYDNTAVDTYSLSKNYNIEKIIHCCWFSREEKPAEYQKCIDSWKIYCPDYEIKEWNSDNYDIEKNKYVKQAYEKKAWAYVSDYARLDVVYHYGGIYLDMDVEVLKNLDFFLKYKSFFSFYAGGYVDLGSGFGAIKNMNLIKELLNEYENIDFFKGVGKPDLKKIIPQPARLLPVFESWGYKKNMKSQIIDDIAILSPDYFKVIDDTGHEYRGLKGSEYAIHWHHAGWFDEQALKERNERIRLNKELHSMFAEIN